jgi:hypothetical protein
MEYTILFYKSHDACFLETGKASRWQQLPGTLFDKVGRFFFNILTSFLEKFYDVKHI